MRIHVVGLGAVGSFVAFHLRRTLASKHDIVGLHRRRSAPALCQNPNGQSIHLEAEGITHTQDGVQHLVYSQPFERHDEPLTEELDYQRGQQYDHKLLLSRPYDAHSLPRVDGHFDSLIVTTKANAVSPVIGALRRFISRDTTIVLLHNGMGVYEKLVKDYFPDPYDRPNFVFGINTHGLWRKDLMHTIQTGVGDIQLGIVPDALGHDFEASLAASPRPSFARLSLDDIADDSGEKPRLLSLRNTIAALTGARALGATWRPFHEFETSMRRKLVVNSFVNPVSALLQCKNGEVLSTGHGHWVLQRLCEEAEWVFRAELEAQATRRRMTYARDNNEQPPRAAFGVQVPLLLRKISLQEEVRRVVEQTKDNYSSMCVDLRLGRDTEIKYINGHLIKLAKKHNVSTLVNEALYNLIKMRCAIPLVRQHDL